MSIRAPKRIVPTTTPMGCEIYKREIDVLKADIERLHKIILRFSGVEEKKDNEIRDLRRLLDRLRRNDVDYFRLVQMLDDQDLEIRSLQKENDELKRRLLMDMGIIGVKHCEDAKKYNARLLEQADQRRWEAFHNLPLDVKNELFNRMRPEIRKDIERRIVEYMRAKVRDAAMQRQTQ